MRLWEDIFRYIGVSRVMPRSVKKLNVQLEELS